MTPSLNNRPVHWRPTGDFYESMKRHQGGSSDNILFFDTHVERWTPEQIEEAEAVNSAVYRQTDNPYR